MVQDRCIDKHRPALVIDCSEIGKAKNDAGLVSALAEQTGMSCSFGIRQKLINRLLPCLLVLVVCQWDD